MLGGRTLALDDVLNSGFPGRIGLVQSGDSFRFPYLYQLRAGDSAQLAAAIIGFGNKPYGKKFLSFDSRLCRAAGREGFDLITDIT